MVLKKSLITPVSMVILINKKKRTYLVDDSRSQNESEEKQKDEQTQGPYQKTEKVEHEGDANILYKHNF